MSDASDLPSDRALLEALFEHSRDAIYLHDVEGRFLDANRAALELLGYARSEVRSTHLSSLLTSEEDLARARAAIETIVTTGRPDAPEIYQVRRKDGARIVVEVSSALVHEPGRPPAVLGIARDVTERERNQESVRFQAQMLDSVEQAVIASDAAGRILYVNRFASRLYGWPADEMVGRDIREVTYPDIGPEQAAEIMDGLRRGRSWTGELTVQRRDGTVFFATVTDTPLLDERGGLVAIISLSLDVSERKQHEEALRSSEERYRTLVELSHDLVWAVDRDGRITYMSPASRRIYGREPEEMVGRIFTDFAPPGEDERTAAARAEHNETGEPYVEVDARMLHRDGHLVLLRANAVPLRDASGRIQGYFGASEDMTAERGAQDALSESEERFRVAVLAAPIPIMIHAEDGEVLAVNDAWTASTGWGRAEIPSIAAWVARAHDADRDAAQAHLAALFLPDAGRREDELRATTRSGETRIWMWASAPLGRTSAGRRIAISMASDVTERRFAEQELLNTEMLLEKTFAAMSDAVLVVELSGRTIKSCNAAAERMFGWNAAELIGASTELLYVDHESYVAFGRASRGPLDEHGEFRTEYRLRRRDGTILETEIAVSTIRADLGWGHGLVSVIRDITRRKRSESELRLHAAALNATADAVVIVDRHGAIVWVNPGFTVVTGYESSEAIGRSARELLDAGVQAPSLHQAIEEAMSSGDVWRGEVRNRRKNHSLYPAALTVTPVRDEAGEVAQYVAIERDLTALKRLEAQYRQAQKMESIGRLAGGIAHDFNNLLTVILGEAELLVAELEADDELRSGAQEISVAGQRAATLTRQLLAFSRKQILQPAVIDLGRLALDWRGVLQRLVGETIELEIAEQEGTGRVNADPGQLEQVIMNLVVNARDAMPEGGRLTIAVRDEDLEEELASGATPVPTGRYVTLRVRDTGTGMDEKTQEKLFEPFFTTKPPGQGTGLGLATVYGIVEQSGGHVRVETREGVGTAFSVYLPRHLEEPAPAQPLKQTRSGPRGAETLLVVEDEAAVRALARGALESAGYTVLTAGDGVEALERLEQHDGRVHLVFTDVVLPGMTGRHLAERIQSSHPGIRVLFTSGYMEDDGLRHGILDARAPFLPKPYTASRLQARIREVLDVPI